MTEEQRKIAQILAGARVEALELRPLSCAAINSIIDRLASMWEDADPAFDRQEFRVAANYRGLADGTTGFQLLPSSTPL